VSRGPDHIDVPAYDLGERVDSDPLRQARGDFGYRARRGTTDAHNPGENAVTSKRRDESGTALLLALGFMVVLGLIGAAMLSSISSGLRSRFALDDARTREYAADSGIQYAVTQVRSLPAPGAGLSGCASGTHYSYTSADNPPVTIRINCSNFFQVTRTGFQQRNVVFNACEENGSDCTDPTSIIRAQVNFQTVGSGGPDNVTRTWIQSWSVHG
jgi:Tfp pilus assembly protein PilX